MMNNLKKETVAVVGEVGVYFSLFKKNKKDNLKEKKKKTLQVLPDPTLFDSLLLFSAHPFVFYLKTISLRGIDGISTASIVFGCTRPNTLVRGNP